MSRTDGGAVGPRSLVAARRTRRAVSEVEARDSRSVTHLQRLPSGPDPGCIGPQACACGFYMPSSPCTTVGEGSSATFVTVAPSVGFPDSS